MAIPRVFSAALSLAMVLALTGCGLFGPRITREMRRSPDYRAGYQDGCSSAPGPDANQRNGFDQVKDQVRQIVIRDKYVALLTEAKAGAKIEILDPQLKKGYDEENKPAK